MVMTCCTVWLHSKTAHPHASCSRADVLYLGVNKELLHQQTRLSHQTLVRVSSRLRHAKQDLHTHHRR